MMAWRWERKAGGEIHTRRSREVGLVHRTLELGKKEGGMVKGRLIKH